MFGGGRAERKRLLQRQAERAELYSKWLLEEETVAEWRQHAEQVPVTHTLADGHTLRLQRWWPPRRAIVAEKVLAAQQRLAFAQGALSERLGGDTSPLWEFGWDGCHEMFEVHARVIREVFLKFEWDIAVVADPELHLDVTRRESGPSTGDPAAAALDAAERELAEVRLAEKMSETSLHGAWRPGDQPLRRDNVQDNEEGGHCVVM